jgi:hypothetical protein
MGGMVSIMTFAVITLPSARDRSEKHCAADLAEGLATFDRAVSTCASGARVVLVDESSGDIIADSARR